ncbi:hypothetical protein [Bradyrhizobium betae]|uniref:Uncharacterized protein n=1 Tax=Bradyrhizobium betae TaxID=244734 RepID=A0A4Q1VGF9_9BRAD|nr:hypothetical protein [Bradyrhizobium betae]RXT50026.1 hypothetical protein B5V03_09205 [Bradyrhizobium betae]
MRSATLLALSLMVVGVWSLDGARGQTAPPVSLAPPNASPPHANAKNSRIPSASGRETSTSVPGVTAPAPNPAADYDGFSAVDDNDTASQPPVSSHAAKGSRSNPDTKGTAAQQLIDQEDETLKRKLTICKNCK